MINSDILKKYYDCVLLVKQEKTNAEHKKYDCHKIILANYSKYFENLFDFNNSSVYQIEIPFQIEIFDEIYNNIYEKENDNEIIKDINYYENKLYALNFLLCANKQIKIVLAKLIKKLKIKKEYVNKVLENMKSNNIFNNKFVNLFESRVKYITNPGITYYDDTNKILTIFGSTNNCYDSIKFSANNLIFTVYMTRAHLDEISYGFWIVARYEDEPEQVLYKDMEQYKNREKIYCSLEIEIIDGVNKTINKKLPEYKSTDLKLPNKYTYHRGDYWIRERYGYILEDYDDKYDPSIMIYKFTIKIK